MFGMFMLPVHDIVPFFFFVNEMFYNFMKEVQIQVHKFHKVEMLCNIFMHL